MKKLLSFFAVICLVGIVSVKAQSANDRFFVLLDGVEADEICVIDIYGKQVKRLEVAEGVHTISMQGFAK